MALNPGAKRVVGEALAAYDAILEVQAKLKLGSPVREAEHRGLCNARRAAIAQARHELELDDA